MKKAFVLLALGAIVLIVAMIVLVRGLPADDAVVSAERATAPAKPSALPEAIPARPSAKVVLSPVKKEASAACRIPRAKEALIALFAVKPGEMPPELPQLTFEERNLLPMVIENELTDADGCDAEAVRREFRLYMEFGGNHADFLPAYRRKLLKRVRR